MNSVATELHFLYMEQALAAAFLVFAAIMSVIQCITWHAQMAEINLEKAAAKQLLIEAKKTYVICQEERDRQQLITETIMARAIDSLPPTSLS